jgi:sodium transport system permease protein
MVTLITLGSMFQLFGQQGEAGWQLWVPASAQLTLMDRVLKGTPIGIADIAPTLAICLAITVAGIAFVSRQLARRAAQ